jgi:putative transcriptional regulator
MASMDNKIRVLRAGSKLSQAELAEKVGVRRETIGHLENNRYMPSLKLAYNIAKAFGKRIEEVFLFSDDQD